MRVKFKQSNASTTFEVVSEVVFKKQNYYVLYEEGELKCEPFIRRADQYELAPPEPPKWGDVTDECEIEGACGGQRIVHHTGLLNIPVHDNRFYRFIYDDKMSYRVYHQLVSDKE